MAIEQIDIENFIKLSEKSPAFDVRSPGEFLHAHIPGAFSLPLFSDGQRKVIGTAYKQQSRQIAVKKGLDYFSERMKNMISEAEEIIKQSNKNFSNENRLLVHCWRGGMRSRSVAWLLDLYGFKVFTLNGGYKAFRNWALQQFEKEYSLKILGGYTGSGKTGVLQEMKENGVAVIDLEGLANHKGSAFGSLGEAPQPGQEMFENILAIELFRASTAKVNAEN
ncbi:MAG: tRNA 2-selenouridine(34) synthase MnmH, partial [Ginsengibacter sp.]